MSQGENIKKDESFSIRLKALRLRRGLGQEELAEKLKVSKGSIGNWETDGPPPGPSNLRKIAEFFGVTIPYLLGEEIAYSAPRSEMINFAEDAAKGTQPLSNVSPEQECRDHLERFLETCADDPRKLAWTFIELQEKFPLNKWRKEK